MEETVEETVEATDEGIVAERMGAEWIP